MAFTPEENIENITASEEMRTSFTTYGLSVIMARALPDVRDGLKPVQRRVLHAMRELNLTPSNSYVKCARVVGEAMGRFHPHGDSAIYEAMVRMARDFNMNATLVDGHGNFGTHDDGAAAMRYCVTGDTRVRMGSGAWRRIEDMCGPVALEGESTISETVSGRAGEVLASRWFDSGAQPVLRMDTSCGRSLAGSANHPVLSLQSALGVPAAVWMTLEELRPGDVVLLQRGTTPGGAPSELFAAAGMAAVAGFSESLEGTSSVAFESRDEEEAAAFAELLPEVRVTSFILPATRADADRARFVRAHSAPEALVASAQGSPGGREIPEAVWSATPSEQAGFVSGVFALGRVKLKRGAVHCSVRVASEQFARDLQVLALGVGLSLGRERDGHGGWLLSPTSTRDVAVLAHALAVPGAVGEQLRVSTPALDESPADHLPLVEAYLKSQSLSRVAKVPSAVPEDWSEFSEDAKCVLPFLDGRFTACRVSRIHHEPKQQVYTLRIDSEDHAFVTDGFWSHNTESRMSQHAMLMTDEISEDAVDMIPTYDGKELQPSVLPAAFPNLLVNGTTGIAVGMATDIPPHNLVEVIAACRHLLANPSATVEDMIGFIAAPDMPTGGILLQQGGAQDAYRTGRGSFVVRARTEIQGRDIVVTELPYGVGPESLLKKLKLLKDSGRLNEVAEAANYSDRRHGMRIVIKAKRHAAGVPVNPQAVLAKLFKLTPLQENYRIQMLALRGSQPITMNLLDMVAAYVDHRIEVTTRRCEYRRTKAQTRAHLLEGYKVALENIDAIVTLLKSSRDTESARNKLMKQYRLTEVQAVSILEMPLRRLTGLELRKILEELEELHTRIVELTRYLDDSTAMRGLISTELESVSAKYGRPRRTTISSQAVPEEDFAEAMEIPDEPVRVQLSSTGKIGRFPSEPHKGARNKDDALVYSIDSTLRGQLGAVSSAGTLHHLHVVDIPEGGKTRGLPVQSLVNDLEEGATIVGLVSIGPEEPMIALATRNGVVKRVASKDYPKVSGQPVIAVKEGDSVIAVLPLPGDPEQFDLVLVTDNAQLLRFSSSAVRPQGAKGAGVAGMKLAEGAHVVAAGAVPPEGEDSVAVFTVSDSGAAKQSPVSMYPAKGRGTGGVRCQRFTRQETSLVAALVATPELVVGVSATGGLVRALPDVGRRDAPGVRGESAQFRLLRM